jgi:hypothetical protein
MKLYIQATQGVDRFFLTDVKRPDMSINVRGYLLDKKQGLFTPAGIEIFSGGYWEEASGEMEIDGNPGPRPTTPQAE